VPAGNSDRIHAVKKLNRGVVGDEFASRHNPGNLILHRDEADGSAWPVPIDNAFIPNVYAMSCSPLDSKWGARNRPVVKSGLASARENLSRIEAGLIFDGSLQRAESCRRPFRSGKRSWRASRHARSTKCLIPCLLS